MPIRADGPGKIGGKGGINTAGVSRCFLKEFENLANFHTNRNTHVTFATLRATLRTNRLGIEDEFPRVLALRHYALGGQLDRLKPELARKCMSSLLAEASCPG